MPKIMSNNPLRKSNSWPIAGPKQTRWRGLAKKSVTRLMKVDPSVAKGTPDNQIVTSGVNGVKGGTGTGSSAPAVLGRHETRQRPLGTSQSVVRSDGINRSLTKR